MPSFKKILGKELIIASSILAVLIFILAFLSFKITTKTNAISKNIQDILDRSASIKLLSTIQAQYDSNGKRYLEVLKNSVPTKDSLIDLQKEFQTIAALSNIGFGFAFLGETPKSNASLGYVMYRLNLQSSDMNALFGFLKRLENFRYVNSIEGVSINRGADGQVQMVVRGQVYFR